MGPNDPALLIVTDFSREHAWTVAEDRAIDDALRDMICAGVRALLVMRNDAVTGLITSYDIEPRGPPAGVQAADSARIKAQVVDIMTPWVRAHPWTPVSHAPRASAKAP